MNETIVDELYLREHLRLSESFIARHSRSMGCFARKPRRFFLAQVMAHLEFLAAEAQARAHGRKSAQTTQIRNVRRMADHVIQSKYKKLKDGVTDFAEYFARQYDGEDAPGKTNRKRYKGIQGEHNTKTDLPAAETV